MRCESAMADRFTSWFSGQYAHHSLCKSLGTPFFGENFARNIFEEFCIIESVCYIVCHFSDKKHNECITTLEFLYLSSLSELQCRVVQLCVQIRLIFSWSSSAVCVFVFVYSAVNQSLIMQFRWISKRPPFSPLEVKLLANEKKMKELSQIFCSMT